MATETHKATDYKLPIAGEWVETGDWEEVTSPYDRSVIARVAKGTAADVARAAAAARKAFEEADFPQHRRAEVLDRAAALVLERHEDLARTICLEAGKPMKQARVEALRASSTLTFSAVECRKLTGETVPMEASVAGMGKLGVVLRLPLGVVGAISPFNFPLNLVAHKLGPAIAAGNAAVLKPATVTPVSSIKLAEVLYDAGLPEGWLNVVVGSGADVGNAIVEHPDVAMITFTGSAPVGWDIRSKVPHKRVSLELGSNAPLIVNEDGDWQTAADKAKVHGFSHAGQSCISIQRILLHDAVAEDFTARFVENVRGLKLGDPLDEDVDVGPVIDEPNRDRVKQWVDAAVASGAELLTGGEVTDQGLLEPTVLRNVSPDQDVICKEIFGPVACINTFSSFEEGLAMANDSVFGLQAGVFTRDVGRALLAGRTLDFGGVCVNEVPTFRADQQPYGGVKDSGNTREGPAYTIKEMTEQRLVTLQGE